MTKIKSKVLVLLFDFFTINLAWIIYSIFRLESGWFEVLTIPQVYVAGALIYIYWLFLFFLVGMYQSWFACSRFDELSTLTKTIFVGIFILFFVILFDDYRQEVPSSNRFLIFIYAVITLIFTSAGRLTLRSLQRRLLIKGYGRKKAFIVGFNSKANKLHEKISLYKPLGIDVAGYIAVKKENVGKEHLGVKVIGIVGDIEKYIEEFGVKDIIIALESHDEDLFIKIISLCDSKNVGVKIAPDLYSIITGQARTLQIYGFPLIDIMPQLMPEWEKRAKRIMDISFSFLFLLLSSPIILLASIAIKLESKGPVLYKQERAGLNGKPFNIYKFRSMRIDAEKYTGPIWSQKDDPRITRVGKFIRKVRMDEIPQFINVLKGEMSFVGPRPERPFFVEKLSKDIPLYKKRLKVRPGITGWAQVKHKYDETLDDVKVKLRYDLFYIENMSLRMDLKIIFRTVFIVLFGKGHFE